MGDAEHAEAVVESLESAAKAHDTAAASLIANRYCRAPRPTLPAINLPLPTNPADAARVVVKAASSDDTIAVELASA